MGDPPMVIPPGGCSMENPAMGIVGPLRALVSSAINFATEQIRDNHTTLLMNRNKFTGGGSAPDLLNFPEGLRPFGGFAARNLPGGLRPLNPPFGGFAAWVNGE